MFGKLKQRLKAWADGVQQREIARLREANLKLREEIEQETGCPIELAPEERSRLAELSQRIDGETLKEISVFGHEQFPTAEVEKDPAENP